MLSENLKLIVYTRACINETVSENVSRHVLKAFGKFDALQRSAEYCRIVFSEQKPFIRNRIDNDYENTTRDLRVELFISTLSNSLDEFNLISRNTRTKTLTVDGPFGTVVELNTNCVE